MREHELVIDIIKNHKLPSLVANDVIVGKKNAKVVIQLFNQLTQLALHLTHDLQY